MDAHDRAIARRDERVSRAVRAIVACAEDAQVSLKDEAQDYFRWCCEPLTDSEQQLVLEALRCGHSDLVRADGCCMCDQHRIIRGELPYPVVAIHEAPCCVPNAHGACSSTCPRVAYNRGHVRDSEQVVCAGRDLIPSRTT